MNARNLSLGAIVIFQIALVGVVLSSVRQPEANGFILIGAVVGWMLYYFIRRYTLFNPRSLAATLSAILGGEALAWLGTLRGTTGPVEFQYFTGLGIGFFVYAAYAGFCSWLFALGYIKSPLKFEIAIGCGPSTLQDITEIEELIEFEDRVEKWMAGSITDEQLRSFIDGLDMSKKKLLKYISSDESLVGNEAVTKLRQGRMLPVS